MNGLLDVAERGVDPSELWKLHARSSDTDVNGNQADNSASAAGAAYVFVRDGSGNWSQQAYLKASNTDADDRFSGSVAIAGDTVVVGAQREGSNATGVNGNQADDSAGSSGAVYVFNTQAGIGDTVAVPALSCTGLLLTPLFAALGWVGVDTRQLH